MTDAFIMCFVKWPENTVDDFLGHFGESRCFENPQTRENPMRFPVYDKHHLEPQEINRVLAFKWTENWSHDVSCLNQVLNHSRDVEMESNGYKNGCNKMDAKIRIAGSVVPRIAARDAGAVGQLSREPPIHGSHGPPAGHRGTEDAMPGSVAAMSTGSGKSQTRYRPLDEN